MAHKIELTIKGCTSIMKPIQVEIFEVDLAVCSPTQTREMHPLWCLF